jgi:septum formation protein
LTVPILLASSSPRRRELLSSLGLTFEVVAADIDETLRDGESAFDGAERLAREKAAVVENERPDALVIAADTLVVLDGAALGKPGDAATARRMLRGLAGRWHEVVTGVAVAMGGVTRSAREITRVEFAPLTSDEIERYVASGEPLDRAGAYAMQERAGLFVTRVDGSPSNVIGLPVRLVRTLALELGVDLLSPVRTTQNAQRTTSQG